MALLSHIETAISTHLGEPFHIKSKYAVGGGCINQAITVSDGLHRFFVKTNHADKLAMFEAEAAGLAEIHRTRTARVPQVVAYGCSDETSYLALEYIDLTPHGSHAQLGEQLAAMHRHTATHFGWHRDNTIGSTPQPNALRAQWSQFYGENRLSYQLQLAAAGGHQGRLQKLGDRVLTQLPRWLEGYRPQASLLHGDLWSGNHAFDAGGTPVLFDPAVYYGDREADVAMTELFGGFPGEFFQAYQRAWPLDDGYRWRKTLYNLYHILNHLNLFGGGYQAQAVDMMERLLAERG